MSWDLGGVDFDLCVPPSCPAAKFPSAQAESGRQWNTRNPSQQNPVSAQLGHPVVYFWALPSRFAIATRTKLRVRVAWLPCNVTTQNESATPKCRSALLLMLAWIRLWFVTCYWPRALNKHGPHMLQTNMGLRTRNRLFARTRTLVLENWRGNALSAAVEDG